MKSQITLDAFRNLFNNILCISFLTIFKAQPGDSSDLHPLREIASVIMTSSGFISETREGRMADAKTPIVRQMSTVPTTATGSETQATGNSGAGGSDQVKTPQAPSKAKPSKPADETDSEGIIEDSDDENITTSIPPGKSPAPAAKTPAAGTFLFVFRLGGIHNLRRPIFRIFRPLPPYW